MPWFYCDDCGDTIKKPKLAAHCSQCSASGFTCIDCSRPFDRRTVQGHTQCVTEHEKYAQGATKPGGFAEKGFFSEAPAQQAQQAGAPEGLEFLSSRAPWNCSVCNVACTSRETLLGHAAGAKHKRRAIRAKAALAAAKGAAVPEDAQPVAAEAASAAAQAAVTADKSEGETAAGAHMHKGGGKSSAGKPPKWKKLAATELKRSGGKMKSKKLLAALLLAPEAAAAWGVDSTAVLQKLQGSGRFVFEGKQVRLNAAA